MEREKKQNNITRYELAVIFKPLLPEDIKDKVIPKMEKLAAGMGGDLQIKESWGKKHLAYPIAKHQEGHYVFFALQLDGSQTAEFGRQLKLIPDVLRFLTISEDEL